MTEASNKAEEKPPLTNAQRLGSHLPANSLASALLADWSPAQPAEKRRERLLQTLASHNPEQAQTDAAAANKD
jgi:hypothetical protein